LPRPLGRERNSSHASSCVPAPAELDGAMSSPAPEQAQGPRALLAESEVQRLLLAASERAPTGVRNRALVALLYCTGLRLGEALALAPGDCDLEAEAVAVGAPRARAAHLFPPARPYLETWLAARASLALPPGAPLFCTLAGAPLEPAYVRAMLARLGRRAGLSKRVHAHLLRHSSAARLARAGVAATALAEQLGHGTARGAARSLARFGVALAEQGLRSVREARWSLAPEPGAVRALVRSPASVRSRAAPSSGVVLVRRWTPEEFPY
jgi:integrase